MKFYVLFKNVSVNMLFFCVYFDNLYLNDLR